jgi:hypothetical protein
MRISVTDMAMTERVMRISATVIAMTERAMRISVTDIAITERVMRISVTDMAMTERAMRISATVIAMTERAMGISLTDMAMTERVMRISATDASAECQSVPCHVKSKRRTRIVLGSIRAKALRPPFEKGDIRGVQGQALDPPTPPFLKGGMDAASVQPQTSA